MYLVSKASRQRQRRRLPWALTWFKKQLFDNLCWRNYPCEMLKTKPKEHTKDKRQKTWQWQLWDIHTCHESKQRASTPTCRHGNPFSSDSRSHSADKGLLKIASGALIFSNHNVIFSNRERWWLSWCPIMINFSWISSVYPASPTIIWKNRRPNSCSSENLKIQPNLMTPLSVHPWASRPKMSICNP